MHCDDAADGAGDAPQIVGVAGDNHVLPRKRRDDDDSVDEVTGPAARQRRTSRPGLGLAQRRDPAAPQQSRELGLRSPAPHLAEHGCRKRRTHTTLEQTPVERPHRERVALGGDQRACIVGDAAHATRATLARSSAASAAASASDWSCPCSASHSATAARPSSIANALQAASFNQADRLIPRRPAASLASCATCSSSATDSFSTAIS
jgi:hypothetical protein